MFFLENFFPIFSLILLFIFSWIFFIKNNFMAVRIKFDSNVKLKNSKFLKKNNFNNFISFSLVVYFYLFLTLFFFKGYSSVFWSNHCYVNSGSLYIIILILIVIIYSYVLLKDVNKSNLILNNDFFFSLLNLILLTPFLFFTNSIYSFLFVLEAISLVVFYKFILSKFWFKKKNKFFEKKNFLSRFFSKSYLNVLFFQYWVNFFSSVIIIFSLLNIIFQYGSSEWFFINFISFLERSNSYFYDFEFNVIFWIPFFLSIFFKIGLTPTHLFKIEVYKGIPFISIFFYTTYYFLVYVIFFFLFITVFLNSLSVVWWLFLFCIIVFGMFYTLFLLFDVFFTKAFFAYSTVINTLGFFIVLVSSF